MFKCCLRGNTEEKIHSCSSNLFYEVNHPVGFITAFDLMSSLYNSEPLHDCDIITAL